VYGENRSLTVAAGNGRSLRLHAVGVDEPTLQRIADSATIDGDGLTFAALPGGFRVLSATPVDRDQYVRNILTYEVAPDRGAGANLAAFTAIEDPVAVAEGTIAFHHQYGGTVEARAGGQPALTRPGAVSTIWRVGATLQRIEVRSTSPQGDGAGTDLASRIRPLGPDDRAGFVIASVTVGSWATGPADQMTYPVDAAAQSRLDAFDRALPAGFERFTEDPPAPLDVGGIPARARNQATDSWIDLTMVPSTTGPPPGDTTMRTTHDDGRSRAVRWRSPSGWTYALETSSTSSDQAPLTIDQMHDLLDAIEEAPS
jgi:hypothetical protein